MICDRFKNIAAFLDANLQLYNGPNFIGEDPVSIPHRFRMRQDIEISGLFAALFAWGNRSVIIRKASLLMDLMDNAPYDFCMNYQLQDLSRFNGFVHRTFNQTDLLAILRFLQFHYAHSDTLESAFYEASSHPEGAEQLLNHFNHYFRSVENCPTRTLKHISAPRSGSACKRLNMFLRWMVRRDKNGVDFGIWNIIPPSRLICPIDVHVARVSKRLGLLSREKPDWKAAVELTENLKIMDPEDPVKYDFVLFGSDLPIAESLMTEGIA